MTTIKEYTIFPVKACIYFKQRDLYLLAGLYINAHYQKGVDYITTDTTYKQLSELTGVPVYYIKESFVPKLRASEYIQVRTVQVEPEVKRNTYYLPNPNINFRYIWKELFDDKTLTPDEKGFMIGLYCMCANNEFRIDLSDKLIYSHLDMAKNTYKKYRDLLIEKKVIWSSYDVPMALTWTEHMDAKVILYPHLGHTTWIDKVTSHTPDDDEIKDYLDTIKDE